MQRLHLHPYHLILLIGDANLLPIHTFPNAYTHAYLSIISLSFPSPFPLHSFHSHITCTICCGKKNPPIKYGCGENAAIFLLCISIMLGLEKMPYCCAAKSYRKDSGASTRTVEEVLPMVVRSARATGFSGTMRMAGCGMNLV